MGTAYRRGFETDWRDHYPGINAVTLMELKEPPDSERLKLIPVVRYLVERRIASSRADCWDWATLLKLAVLAKEKQLQTRHSAKCWWRYGSLRSRRPLRTTYGSYVKILVAD
jgi:hypothetical protein